MPFGKGTYGSKKGRPAKKKMDPKKPVAKKGEKKLPAFLKKKKK